MDENFKFGKVKTLQINGCKAFSIQNINEYRNM